MSGPKIGCSFSIVIPTRDRPEMLSRAIKSVFMQTYEDYELIVVDDGSDQPVTFRDHETKSARIIRHSAPAGSAAARNAGIEAAVGRYIAFLDDDDEYHPAFLERAKSALAQGAPFSWCGAEIVEYDHTDRYRIATTTRTFPAAFSEPEEKMTATLSVGSGFGLVVDSRCFSTFGVFDTSFNIVEDMELFLRFLAAGLDPAVVPDPLVIIHNHHGGRLTDRRHDPIRAKECERLWRLYHDFVCSHPQVKRQLAAQIARLKGNSHETIQV